MSKGGKKKRSTAGLILDVILTLCTGGLWLIWILIRYLRNNSDNYIFGQRCLIVSLSFFFMLFFAREKNMPFYEERG